MPLYSPKTNNSLLFLLPVLGLFFVVFVDTKWFLILIDWLLGQSWTPLAAQSFFSAMPVHGRALQFSSPVRGILLLASLAALIFFVMKDVDWQAYSSIRWQSWKKSLLAFFILSVLFFPVGLVGWAEEYGETSLILFTKLGEVNNKSRFLMPALANILFFRGYIFYYLFSLGCNFLLLHSILAWFARNEIPLPFWQFLSIGTLSFVSFNFYFSGYPDVLVHMFVLLALALPVGEIGFLIFFALSLATHEASLFVWGALALFLLAPRSWAKFLFIAISYFFLRLASYGFEFSAAFAPQMVGELTPLQWLGQNIGRELLGVFLAFKALWALPLAAVFFLALRRKWRDAALLVALVAASIVITFFGIDTSRLAGWAFPMILISWKALADLRDTKINALINGANALNLAIPSYYASLNFIVIPSGLYSIIFGFFAS